MYLEHRVSRQRTTEACKVVPCEASKWKCIRAKNNGVQLRFTGSWKENYWGSLLFKILISGHLEAYHNVLCCVQKIKLSLNCSYPQGAKGSMAARVIGTIKTNCNFFMLWPRYSLMKTNEHNINKYKQTLESVNKNNKAPSWSHSDL